MTPTAPPSRLVEAMDGAAAQVRAGLRSLLPLALGLQLFASLPQLALVAAHAGLRPGSVRRTLVDLAFGLLAVLLATVVHLLLVVATWDHLQSRPVRLGRVLAVGLRPVNLLALFASGAAIGLGFAACLVPGLVLTVWLALVPALLAVESSGLAALGRSVALVRGGAGRRGVNTWRVVGVLTATMLLGAALSVPAMLPGFVHALLSGMSSALAGGLSGATAPPPSVELLGWALGVPFRALAAVFTSAWLLALLRMLREEQEATELLVALRGSATPGS